jgi:hypothetical protein
MFLELIIDGNRINKIHTSSKSEQQKIKIKNMNMNILYNIYSTFSIDTQFKILINVVFFK